MTVDFSTRSYKHILVALCFLASINLTLAVPESCTMPNCPEGCANGIPFQSPDNNLKRTFLLRKNISFHQVHKRNSTQQFPVSIDQQDMLALFSPGNISVQWQTDDSINLSIDVGIASTDTQFWSFPTIDFIEGKKSVSIDPLTAPYADSFAGSNIVYQGLSSNNQDTFYAYYQLDSLEFLKLGNVVDDGISPILLDLFESEAFLAIEAGWVIDETVTTLWELNTVVDSLVAHKTISVDATGLMTPIGEDPVPTVLSFVEYEFLAYKDGVIFSELVYDAFVWFSTEGHRVYGILEDAAPVEGVTQFSKIIYERYIKPCGDNLDLGIDPLAGEYKAQNQFISSAKLANSPIQFVAGNGVELKAGFSTNGEFEAVTDADPCNY